ncbi:MAG: Gfo/Idh/MocA family oxidoreductase, partial [Bacteroidetes bacterium]|nr:Gfo/Idh/MocA family oxidoreductase [Bacteroidota bacterium]
QRWLPEHRKIEESIRKGVFGDVAFVQAHRWDAAWVPERMISWSDRSTPIHFMSSHDIDLILYWLEDRVRSVSALSHHGTLAAEKGLMSTVDGFSVLLQLHHGAVVSLHSSWILPSILGSKSSVFLSGSGREMRFYGEDKAERVTYGGPATATEVLGHLEGAFTKSLQAFLDAVEKRDLDTPTSAARTIHVVEVQEAIMKAAASGEIVRL